MSVSIHDGIASLNPSSIGLTIKEALLLSTPKFLLELLKGIGKSTKGRESALGLFLILFGTQVYYWKKYSFWSRRNVKTPRVVPPFGNFLSFMTKPRQVLQLEWSKEYGKVYGYYMGTKPYLACADANVLRNICIRDFDKFPNHFFVAVPNRFQRNFLIMQKDDGWRAMRSILTPTFTSGKIKKMLALMDNCAEDLIKQQRVRIAKFGKDDSIVVDARQIMGSLSMGSSLTSFFGINLEYSHKESGEEEVYTKDGFAQRSTEALATTTLRFIVCSLLPVSLLRFLNFSQIRNGPMSFFAENASKIIERRKKSKQSYPDYLQLLLEARAGNELERTETDNQEEHHALASDINTTTSGDVNVNVKSWNSLPKKKLNDFEVTCATIMMMVVATETTAVALCNTIYLLAQNPDVQEKLYKELAKIVKPKENPDDTHKFDYEQLTACQYLDNVISESLRLMQPVVCMDREASVDYFVEEYSFWVPKGTTVMLDFYAIHHDPDYWPEPEKFDPDRFTPENKAKIVPGSYCPFGIGPRSCIGYRFALTEVKIGIAKFITGFKVSAAEGSKYPPEPKKVWFISNEFKDLRVLIQKRE